MGGLLLAGSGLAHDPSRSPLGAGVLLGLWPPARSWSAAATAPALATAGTALAFAPALVAAVGTATGSPSSPSWPPRA